MRLIDADSLIDLVTDSTILGDGFKTAFCALVNGEPTVKVQKTGKWIQAEDITTEYAVCTNCKGHGEFYMDYCWHCGARMVGEEE